eukprot:6557151-Prymnesium_polylepis.1
MVEPAEMQSIDGLSTRSAATMAAMGNSTSPMLRMATVFGARGVSSTALKGRSWPSSTYTRILPGVLSGPCHTSMSASSGRPSVPRTTRTRSTVGSIDHVRSEVPWMRISPASVVGTARPLKRSVPT